MTALYIYIYIFYRCMKLYFSHVEVGLRLPWMLWGPTMLVAWCAGYSTLGRAMPSCSMTPCRSRWMSASDTWSAVRGLRAGALPSCAHRSRPRNDNRTAEPMSVIWRGKKKPKNQNKTKNRNTMDCGSQKTIRRVIVSKDRCTFLLVQLIRQKKKPKTSFIIKRMISLAYVFCHIFKNNIQYAEYCLEIEYTVSAPLSKQRHWRCK